MPVPRRLFPAGIATLAAAMLMTTAYAQTPSGPSAGGIPGVPERAIDTLVPDTKPSLELTVPGGLTDTDGLILDRYTGRGEEFSPPLQWTAGPDGTQSYVLILQDPVEQFENLVVNHWIAYNIPANVTSLPENIPGGASIEGVPGAGQLLGLSVVGYTAPISRTPPPGAPAPATDGGAPASGADEPPADSGQTVRNEGYIFQLFALDTTLNAPDATLGSPANYEALIEGMKSHVLAYGTLEGAVLAPVNMVSADGTGGAPGASAPPAQ